MGYVVRTKFDGMSPDGHRTYFKSGGSSGSGYYENQDKLLGVQADIAQNMYNTYAHYAPGYLNNSAQMTNEAMDGTLASRARSTAGADADNATATGIAAANRSLDRYGATMNQNALAAQTKQAALQGAATKSNAMNSAQQWGEDQKWNRNANAFGQVAGMGNGAMQGMSSAASGYGAMGNAANSNSAANAQGYGAMGAYAGNAMFAADGGYVDDGERRYAIGGPVSMAPVNWRNQATGGPGGSSRSSAIGQFAAPIAMRGAMSLAKPYIKDGLKAVGSSINEAFNGTEPLGDAPMAGGTTDMPLGDAPMSFSGSGTENLGSGVSDAGSSFGASTVPYGALASGAIKIMNGEDAGDALASTAKTVAGAKAGAAIGSVVPGVGTAIGGFLGGLAGDYLADGGEVQRTDMTTGGDVDGPGTETSDDIPAWLSDGEFVLNAEAVKIIGRDKLEALNEQGLAVRGDKKPSAIKRAKKRKYRSGGAVKKGAG